MDRRRFDHFHAELSVALRTLVPRYPLWVAMSECGAHPQGLTRKQLTAYCDEHLDLFLADHDLLYDGDQLRLSDRRRRVLRRTLTRFDPAQVSPYEHMERLGGTTRTR